MKSTTINGVDLYNLFVGGYQNLVLNEKTVDALNVFPVPDGDTGSNMVMTLSGGIEAAKDITDADKMMTTFSRGSLFAARGNSGVILSQFIRGFANGLAGLQSVTVTDFIKAMQSGTDCAYKAVINPVEGTVLTVMRESSEMLSSNFDSDNFGDLLDAAVLYMRNSLNDTPNKLAVLKEAGVIDSGGAGLLCIFEGMLAVLQGKSFESVEKSFAKPNSVAGHIDCNTKLEYGYCTEFILQLMTYKTDISAFKLADFIAFLETAGDSVVAVQDSDVLKVHIHTFEPEKILEFAHKYGEFVTLKIENMTVQHSEVDGDKPIKKKKEHKKFAVVTTASGKGISQYFESIGADIVIEGGQTQNVSAEQFINAFESLDAEHIIVLPNNSNIVMAAKQAAELYDKSNVTVIKNRSIAEGYSALSMIDPLAETLDEFINAMTSNLSNVTTGSVTTATRDTFMNGVEVKKDHFIGIGDDTIYCCTNDKISAALQLLSAIPNISTKETLIVFYGADVSLEEANQLEAALQNQYPLCDIGFIDGGQAVYSFIISIE